MAPLLFKNRYRAPSARLPGWDYSWPGVYAVTICVQGRDCCLGEVVEDEVALSPYGAIVAEARTPAKWKRQRAFGSETRAQDAWGRESM